MRARLLVWDKILCLPGGLAFAKDLAKKKSCLVDKTHLLVYETYCRQDGIGLVDKRGLVHEKEKETKPSPTRSLSCTRRGVRGFVRMV